MFPKPLQALYTDVRFWKELIDSIEYTGRSKDSYSLPWIFSWLSKQYKLNNKYMPS